MEKWMVQAKRADFELWSRELGIDVVTARILRNRNIETLDEAREFIYGSVENIHNPLLLKDMEKAVDYITEAIDAGKKIRIIGDYDVDGVTSTYILSKGLGCLGANVSTAIPHRIHDGYGLSDGLVTDAKEENIDLIITCDNGISAKDQIALANELGMSVIVTDHHEVPFTQENGVKTQVLPDALAVVNPKRLDCEYPFKGICGAMVAYKLICALRDKTGSDKLDEAVMDEMMIFAAIGTVCDVMELKDENRIVVREGLRRIATTNNYGLLALMEVNKLASDKISCYHLGFVIGPCINATGRLDTAERALAMFRADSKPEALTTAVELKALNDSRKNLTVEGIDAAEKYIEENNLQEKDVWVIFLPEVHESIAGIIAGRIRERYNHPVFILTRGEEMVKGSGRSIEGYHMQEHLVEVGELLEKYGGHAMAAGLSLKEENLEALDRALNDNAGLKADDFVAKVSIDVPMPLDYANMRLAKELEKLEPYGTGNPHPLFAQKDLELYGIIPFGAEKQYCRLKVKTPEGRYFEITSFEHPDRICEFLSEKIGSEIRAKFAEGNFSCKISVAYQLGINTFRGENVQFTLRNYC
ncbi:MAG: single-stranded-DNA-specific exonuclease RecJ [Lachnospiraceae bacterium]|nr:single-stranded-DNA-specific exonuclease RecJ [Lachnospiraceae bacterium]